MVKFSSLLKKLARISFDSKLTEIEIEYLEIIHEIFRNFGYRNISNKIGASGEYLKDNLKVTYSLSVYTIDFDFRKISLGGSKGQFLNNPSEIQQQLQKIDSAITVHVDPISNYFILVSFDLTKFHDFNKFEHVLKLLLPQVELQFQQKIFEVFHACGKDFKPGWNSLHGLVYHGISKENLYSLPHIFKIPLRAHAEYNFDSISTTCDFEVAAEFTKFKADTIIQYRINTNQLFVPTLEDLKLLKEDPFFMTRLDHPLRKMEAILIPPGEFVEHEIAVLKSQILTPVQIYLSKDGKTFEKYPIPKDFNEKYELERDYLKSYFKKEQLKNIKSINLSQFIGIQEDLKNIYPELLFNFKFSSYLPNQDYILRISQKVPLSERVQQQLKQILIQEFPQFQFEVEKKRIEIYFDDINLLLSQIKQIINLFSLAFHKRPEHAPF